MSSQVIHRRVFQIGGAVPSVLLVMSILLSACSSGEKQPSQVIAKVNDEEITIHQINAMLQGTELSPNADPKEVQSNALENLINQDLAAQAARKHHLDRDPIVMLQMEQAKRAVLAQAYLRQRMTKLEQPSDAEIDRFYNENPDLFKKRRRYQFAEVLVEGSEEETKDYISYFQGDDANLEGLVARLAAHGISAVVNSVSTNAEDLPLTLVSDFAAMKAGDKAYYRSGNIVHFDEIQGVESAPVDEKLARPRIRMFLIKQNRSKFIKDEIAALRDEARITYSAELAPAKKKETFQSESKLESPKAVQAPDSKAIERGLSGLK